MNVVDPVCQGSGWLWEDAYGNKMTCWRCAGTGMTPGDNPVNKPNGPISSTFGEERDAVADEFLNEEDTK